MSVCACVCEREIEKLVKCPDRYFYLKIFNFFSDILNDRPTVEMLPAHRDVQGAAFGIARLHSLYGINTDRMVDDGVISTHFNNRDILSEPSVMKFNSE